MKYIKYFLFSAFILFSTFVIQDSVFATVIYQTETTLNFVKDGKPYDEAFNFEIECMGYMYPAGESDPDKTDYIPEIVFTLKDHCDGYGCTIDDPFFIESRHIDSCTLWESGSDACTDENELSESFYFQDYADTPVTGCIDNGLGRVCEMIFNATDESLFPATGNCSLPGSDLDAYGCKASAGYQWCPSQKACIRDWETECIVPDDDKEDVVTTVDEHSCNLETEAWCDNKSMCIDTTEGKFENLCSGSEVDESSDQIESQNEEENVVDEEIELEENSSEDFDATYLFVGGTLLGTGAIALNVKAFKAKIKSKK